MSDRPDQKQYWSSNLDPQNLGAGFEANSFDYDAELAYYLIPDQEHALAELAIDKGKRVLDIGAGIGTNSIYMAQRGAIVYAIDIAHDRLAVLRAVCARIAPEATVIPIKCAAEALPFRDGTLDGAYSKSVLIHTRLEEACSEVKRTLRSGGVAVFVEPMTKNPFVNAYRVTLAPQIWRQITNYFGKKQFDTIDKVFGSTKTRYYYFTSFFAFVWQFGVRVPRLFRPSLAVMNAFDNALFSILPFLRKFAWFAAITARK